jgi:hypothetical protein
MSSVPLDQPQKLPALLDGKSHLEAGEFQGGREVVRPLVWSVGDMLRLGMAVGAELCLGGPQVLGRRHGES